MLRRRIARVVIGLARVGLAVYSVTSYMPWLNSLAATPFGRQAGSAGSPWFPYFQLALRVFEWVKSLPGTIQGCGSDRRQHAAEDLEAQVVLVA